MRVVTENVVLGPKRPDATLVVGSPPVRANVFALRLSFVFSFITKVLLARAHNNNALTAGCGAIPCMAAKWTVMSIKGTDPIHNGHAVVSKEQATR